MKELEVTWGRALRIWWAIAWRSFLYTFIPVFIIGAAVGIVFAINDVPVESHTLGLRLVGGLIGLFVGICVIKIVLSKTFSTFRIVLVKSAPAEDHANEVRELDSSGQPAT